jgi:8-oxo-dGTP pyrophosphatase MutT (NUDIX family)
MEPGSNEAIASGTVVVLRQGNEGPEVLMLRRTPSEKDHFNGMWVFPGGKVDPGDLADGELAQARVAAVREAAEEAGLSLEESELLTVDRWEPQPREGLGVRRFATWIFLTLLPQSEGDPVRVDGVEIDQHRWCPPSGALAAHAAGDMGFVGPTWMTLQKIAAFDTLDEIIEWGRGREPVRYFSKVHFGDENHPTVIAWHGDELYDGTPGGRHRLTMVPGEWHFEQS